MARHAYALIFTGGKGPRLPFDAHNLPPDPYICAADSGVDAALSLGFTPDFAIGDFDSLASSENLRDIAHATFGRDKDHTDTELALKHIREQGYTTYVLVGGGEGRLDHLLHLISRFSIYGPPQIWFTAVEILYLVPRTKTFVLPVDTTCAVLPATLEGHSTVSSQGLRWELQSFPIDSTSQSISNRTLSPQVVLEVTGDPVFFSTPYPQIANDNSEFLSYNAPMSQSNGDLMRTSLMRGPLEALYCCIGDPVVGNPTQLMMEAAFRAMAYPGRYITCRVTKNHLEAAIGGLRALGFAGANVTAPHKVAVMAFLDGLTESARLSGAVNCITNRQGRLLGDNTDGKGFLTAVKAHTPVKDLRVLVFGSGGAARAIITELALNQAASITIVNRTLDKAQAIVEALSSQVSTALSAREWKNTYVIDEPYDLVVQATSVGLFKPEETLDIQWPATAGTIRYAADVVFNPVHTRFLQNASQGGAIPIDGLGMLVHQGAITLTAWTERESDLARMRQALDEAFLIA